MFRQEKSLKLEVTITFRLPEVCIVTLHTAGRVNITALIAVVLEKNMTETSLDNLKPLAWHTTATWAQASTPSPLSRMDFYKPFTSALGGST